MLQKAEGILRYDVGIDANKYYPVSIEQIKEFFELQTWSSNLELQKKGAYNDIYNRWLPCRFYKVWYWKFSGTKGNDKGWLCNNMNRQEKKKFFENYAAMLNNPIIYTFFVEDGMKKILIWLGR